MLQRANFAARLKVQELRKRTGAEDDEQKLIELLKEIKCPNSNQKFDIPSNLEEFVEIGNCTREQYYEYAKTRFVILMKVRKPRKRLMDTDDKQNLVALLNIKCPKSSQELEIPDSPEDPMEIWNCGREAYYEYAKVNAGYDPMIEKWFPDKEKKIEQDKNKGDEEKKPSGKRQKLSSKKTRKVKMNRRENVQTTPIRATSANPALLSPENSGNGAIGANSFNGAQKTTKKTQITCPAEKELALLSVRQIT